MVKGWYVYIIECSDKSLYAGVTSDIERRMKEHNSGKGGRYTKARAPVTLVYSETFKTKSEALSREAQLKKWSRAEKKALTEKDCHRLRLLSHGKRCS